MKKSLMSVAAAVLLLFCVGFVIDAASAEKVKCTTIQQKILKYSPTHYLAGMPLITGYDPYGYNYQAHMFSGSYANAYLGGYGFPPYEGDDEAYLAANPEAAKTWVWPYRKDNLIMKWNDAWLSNRDCDYDGKLDRHYGSAAYKGSGAWETNHQSGEYDLDEKTYHWTYFCKIIAVPADAVKLNGIWYKADGGEIGPDIWGEFAVIEEIYNDTGAGVHGVMTRSPAGPGFGKW